jgi:hypothetical protein
LAKNDRTRPKYETPTPTAASDFLAEVAIARIVCGE